MKLTVACGALTYRQGTLISQGKKFVPVAFYALKQALTTVQVPVRPSQLSDCDPKQAGAGQHRVASQGD
jgi:hypothetical protein